MYFSIIFFMSPNSLLRPLTFCIVLLSCKDHRPAAAAAPIIRHRYDPDSAVTFNRLDTIGIFRRLFDNPVMKGDTAIWEPNFYEKQNIQLSYDDSCHTTLDTTMYFKDQGRRLCAVFIFVTYHYWVDSSDNYKIGFGSCHSCGAPLSIALFSQDSATRTWRLYKFEKFWTRSGIFGGEGPGGLGKFSLLPIGDSWTCLMLERPVYANMGEEAGSAELFSIEEYLLGGFPENPLTSILSYDYHSSVDTSDAPGQANKEEDTKLEIEKRKGQYYRIKLATTLNGRLKNTYYRYSDEYNSLVKVKAGRRE